MSFFCACDLCFCTQGCLDWSVMQGHLHHFRLPIRYVTDFLNFPPRTSWKISLQDTSTSNCMRCLLSLKGREVSPCLHLRCSLKSNQRSDHSPVSIWQALRRHCRKNGKRVHQPFFCSKRISHLEDPPACWTRSLWSGHFVFIVDFEIQGTPIQ